MNCEHFEHMLVERAEGLLDEHATRELDAHLASCAACRAAGADFGDLSDRLAAAGAAFGASVLNVPTGEPAFDAPAIVHEAGRTHRPSRARRVVRWVGPLAGIAAIGVAMLFPLGVFDRKAGSAEAATVLTAMNRALEEVQSVSCQIRLIPDEGEMQFGRLTIVAALQIRMDMPDGRVVISDTASGRTQIRLPLEQKFIEAPVREAQPFNLYEKLVTLAEHPSQDLGIEVLDGITARVFVVKGVHGDFDADEYKVWINPHTLLPMKVEMPGQTVAVEGNGSGPGRLVLVDFLYGSQVDPALVSFQPPADYVEAPLTADPQATRMETQVAARNIMMSLFVHQQATGEWPAGLQPLVDGQYMTTAGIRNPRIGDQGATNFGWIYIPPTGTTPDPDRVVITERAPEPWTEVVVAYADGHVEILKDKTRYEQLLAASGGPPTPPPQEARQPDGAKPALDRSSAVTVDPAKLSDKPGAVVLGGRIPLAVLNRDDLQGLSVDGASITEGDAKFRSDRLRGYGYLVRELQVNKFLATDDTVIATMAVGPDNATHGLLSDAAAAMDRTQPPVLIDKIGQRYPALGFVHSTGEVLRIRYFPGKPIKSINDLPSVTASKPDEKLHLVFQVSAGAELTGFAIGDKLIAEFKPAVATKTK